MRGYDGVDHEQSDAVGARLILCWTRGARKGPAGVTAAPGGRSEAGSSRSSSGGKRLARRGSSWTSG